MQFKFDNDLPIHQQLVEQISNYIISGYFKPNDRLPSVREIAEIAQVNHNTIQKALNEIEDLGLIVTNRTNGKFVTDDIDTINKVRDKLLESKVNSFLNDLKQMGIYSIKIEIKKEKDKEIVTHEFSRM